MISSVILVKNEEKNIADCLASLSWCDEILVIDDNSSDKTIVIAEKRGAKVFSHPLQNDFAKQRNFGLEKAKGEWVLFIDADERVTPQLWYEIMQYTNDASNLNTGFYLRRVDHIWGRELRHGETGNIKLLRLAKKDAGMWEGSVHEKWDIKGKTTTLQNALMHYPHQSIKEFLSEINFYSDLRAKELHKKKVKAYWWSIIMYPFAKFMLNFILKLGFLDGLAGLVFALMMSFHSFLVRGKLWLQYPRKEEK